MLIMLYTKKGDKGDTEILGECDQRISKSSIITEALGALDETNSFLGVCKIEALNSDVAVPKIDKVPTSVGGVVADIQNNLFVIQAQIAGADKSIDMESVKLMEGIIGEIEKKLPPIKSFFVSGGTKLSTLFDFSRTIARRAERRVVAVKEEGKVRIDDNTLAYLNRLSSLLYALTRLVNHEAGITEESPKY